jgi:hypothetical protein
MALCRTLYLAHLAWFVPDLEPALPLGFVEPKTPHSIFLRVIQMHVRHAPEDI